MIPGYLNVADAARELNYCRSQVHRLIRIGVLPAVRVGNQYRIAAREVVLFRARSQRDGE